MIWTFCTYFSSIGFNARCRNPVCHSRLPRPRENQTTFPKHQAHHPEMAGHRIIGKCPSRWFLFILRVLNRSCWTLATLSRVSPTWAHPRLPSTQWPSSKSHETLASTLVSINVYLLKRNSDLVQTSSDSNGQLWWEETGLKLWNLPCVLVSASPGSAKTHRSMQIFTH